MSRLKFLIAFLLLTPAAAAQECPRIEVMCPTEALEQGTPMTFSAKVSGGGAANAQFTFNWTVSIGTITSGQGTPSITIDTTGLGGANVKATVEVGGFPQSCARSQSCESGVKVPPLAPHVFDRYQSLKFEDEKARLDNFAIALQQETAMRGYILVYAGKGSRPGEVKRKAKRARAYVTNWRGVDAARVVVVYGGYSKYDFEYGSTQLWILPSDVMFPFPGQIVK